MQKSLPTQTETLRRLSLYVAQKLAQSVQSDDWMKALAFSTILRATVECMKEGEG